MTFKICPVCGNEFGHAFKAARLKKQIYCGRACRQRAKADPGKKSIFICQWCNKSFEKWTYRKPTFCSNQCRSEYAARQPKPAQRRPQNFVTMYCEQCSKEYVVHKSQNENGHTSRFCSRQCMVNWLSDNQRGVNHPNWIGGKTRFPDRGRNWSKQRKLAIARDGYKCQICGKQKGQGMRVEVHHIIPYKEFEGDYLKANDLRNLITLCRYCHVQVEDHNLPCPVYLF